MLGLGGSGSGSPEEIFWAIRRLLEIEAARRPVIVIFDDIQWGEPPLLDLVEHICDLYEAPRSCWCAWHAPTSSPSALGGVPAGPTPR